MRIEMLGCDGAPGPGRFPMSILIDERLLIDAGSVVSALTPQRRDRIENALISHPHLDHIRELGFLPADRDTGIAGLLGTWAGAGTIEMFRRCLFNPAVWSDYSNDKTIEGAKLEYHELQPCINQTISGLQVEAVPLDHPAEALGFIVQCRDKTAVFAVDSGPTELIWERALAGGRVSAIFCDVSLPSRLQDDAVASGHLTPQLLIHEVRKLAPHSPRVFACHLKPEHNEEIRRELGALGIAVEAPVSGDVVEL